MKKYDSTKLIARFEKLNIHDDLVSSIKVHSLGGKVNSAAVIEIELKDYSTGDTKILSFKGCGNLRYAMDFDVLADNWFAQTDYAAVVSDIKRMGEFVQLQMPHWNVTYEPPLPKDKPIRKKMASLRKYSLFKVKFFGGMLEVLAQGFTFKRLRRQESS